MQCIVCISYNIEKVIKKSNNNYLLIKLGFFIASNRYWPINENFCTEQTFRCLNYTPHICSLVDPN